MSTRRAAILETCNAEADAAARSGDLPEVGAAEPLAAEPPLGLPGLRAEYRTSAPAREAFAACMDKRAFEGFPPPTQRGNG